MYSNHRQEQLHAGTATQYNNDDSLQHFMMSLSDKPGDSAFDPSNPFASAKPLLFLEEQGLARRFEALGAHTTMKVGGRALWWAGPENEEQLRAVLQAAHETGVRLQLFGAGSNLVASDNDFKGLALKLGQGFVWHRIEDNRLVAGGAMMLPKLTHIANQNRLGNFEWACGIPGTLGGSIWGNAGARGFNGQGFESRDAGADLESLVAFDRAGNRHFLRRDEIEFSYRRSSLGELIVVEATFNLKPLSEDETRTHKEAITQLLKIRRETQPVNAASSGCIWKNPNLQDGPFAGCGAGALIEKLGLKGHTSGKAMISDIHANFIVNTGGATGDDVRALMASVEQIVLEEVGVRLEREARLLD
ncbi:MAG TPA: UDP-N-acetylmuramate dehydrogenase [Abditibacteriaceae bacterium]